MSLPLSEHRLEDYRPPAFTTQRVRLRFELDPEATLVEGELEVVRQRPGPLELYGHGLETLAFAVDGRALDPRSLPVEGEVLRLDEVPDHARLRIVTRIHPRANAALSGLYESGGLLLTQCEAEGFRRILWSQDRPDVLARYHVRLEADRARYPVLLANGHPVAAGTLAGGRHFAEWEDPFPKPSYLFALVAGDLDHLEARHRTPSGRDVVLRLHGRRGELGRCRWALAALADAMAWDEAVYGLECDLDLYQIVGVPDFNFGAMENKGLNIFNVAALLADPDIATDRDYLRIARIVAHEYFHNWTGNRVTLRDWFQLTLKEGLTVLRDQQFASDRQSRGVTRIQDVRLLQEVQFPEDAGPLAHPIRPKRYVAIDNFYTATVYYKGAEVLRMLEVLLGRRGFVRGVRHYLRTMDGRAATVEDFLRSMAEASGRDLTAFARWYEAVGTPRLEARWRQEGEQLHLWLRQHRPDGDPAPLLIPVALALFDRRSGARLEAVGPDGRRARDHLLVMESPELEAVFRVGAVPVLPSLLRDFSAPVMLEAPYAPEDLAALFAWEDDPFARWDAGQKLALQALEARYAGGSDEPARVLAGALARVLAALPQDRLLAAELLGFPSRNRLAERVAPFDPLRVDRSWRELRRELAEPLAAAFSLALDGLQVSGPFRPDLADMGARALRGQLLAWLALAAPAEAEGRILRLWGQADNLTDRMAALEAALLGELAPLEQLLEDLARRFAHEPLVMDKWYALQARREDPECLERIRRLSARADFDRRNPNRVRALYEIFARTNLRGFHQPDGAGYRLLAEAVATIDRDNPQLAARLAVPLTRFARLSEPWRSAMRAAVEALARRPAVSRDLGEVLTRALSTGRT